MSNDPEYPNQRGNHKTGLSLTCSRYKVFQVKNPSPKPINEPRSAGTARKYARDGDRLGIAHGPRDGRAEENEGLH